VKFLIIGLGSMGKRRIRCLKALGYQKKDISGFDLREDRRNEAEQKYGIRTYDQVEPALSAERPYAMIISVPPDIHHVYMEKAIDQSIHFFVEASVVDTKMDEIRDKLRNMDIVAAPSATWLFHPAIKIVQEVYENGNLGKISNVIYHAGLYLPDWHTYEKVSDFYVSNPATGGAREIVPFELSWITRIFGFPKRVSANFRKTIDIEGAEQIDDTYNILLDYSGFLATLTVDVVSRCGIRRLMINGDKKQLRWDWDDNCIKIFDPERSQWERVSYEMGLAESGYHPNIGENHYVDETKNFIDAIEGKRAFVNDLENDHNVLKLLYAIEKSDKKSLFVRL